MPNWRLATRWADYRSEDDLVVVAGRESDAVDTLDLGIYGGNSDWALHYWMHDRVSGLAHRWALLSLMRRYQERISSQRDLVAAEARGRTSVRDLEAVRRGLVDTTMDARICLTDISHFASTEHLYLREVVDWDAPTQEWLRELYDTSLIERWQEATSWQAERLGVAQEGVAELVRVDSDLRGLIANLRLQRTVQWLAVIAALVGILTLVVAWRAGH
jgi:hypothetical protein